MAGKSRKKEIADLGMFHLSKIPLRFNPSAWKKAKHQNRDWTELKFPYRRKKDIPKEPGVYAFIAEPGLFSLQPANGLFYIGMSKNLYDRIGKYKSELSLSLERTQRPHVWFMINHWDGHLRYYYTTTESEAEALELEDKLLSAFYPPFNREVDAITRRFEKAFP